MDLRRWRKMRKYNVMAYLCDVDWKEEDPNFLKLTHINYAFCLIKEGAASVEHLKR